MGCDIHLYLEVYNDKLNKWGMLDGYGLPVMEEYEMFTEEYYKHAYKHSPSQRNYGVFAVLADVRNDNLPYMDQPRGVPKDASLLYKSEVEHYGEDGHSHSYFTVEEFLNDYNGLYNDIVAQGKRLKDPWDFRETAFFKWIKFLSEQGIPHNHLRVCFYFDN
jgi:hypothetical protein